MMLTGLFTVQEEYLRYCVRKGLDPAAALPSLAGLGKTLSSVTSDVQASAAAEIGEKEPERSRGEIVDANKAPRRRKSKDGRRFSDHARRFLDLRSEGYDLKRRHETPDTRSGGRFTKTSRGNFEGTVRLTVLKEPRVVGVDLFPALFPLDRCLIVFRSGKHVVDSYMRTFASGAFSRTFEDVCAEVAVATEKALALCEMLPGNMVRAVRYEDAAADRAASAADILAWAEHAARLPEGSDLNAMPVLGSSTHSKGEGGKVSWTPRKAEEGFNPAARPVKWSAAQESAFERICGAANRRAGYQ